MTSAVRYHPAMIRHLRLLLPAIVFVVLVSGPAASVGQQPPMFPKGVVIVRAGEVQWKDYPGRPGVMLSVIEGDLAKPGPFLMRVKFPAGYAAPPHTHPTLEHTTILTGSMRIGYGTRDDGPSQLLMAGSIILTPANTPHFFSVPVETIVQTHGTGPWGSTQVK